MSYNACWNRYLDASLILITACPKCPLQSNMIPMQLALLASFAVTVVSASPPLSGVMDALVDALMAVMREDAVS